MCNDLYNQRSHCLLIGDIGLDEQRLTTCFSDCDDLSYCGSVSWNLPTLDSCWTSATTTIALKHYPDRYPSYLQ